MNKSNILYKKQLKVCCDYKVDYIITSLGSPEETINMAKKAGVLVFCDVVNLEYLTLGAGAHAGGSNSITGEIPESLWNKVEHPILMYGQKKVLDYTFYRK